MADAAPKDTAAKDRIIKHLNTEHQISLSYYLRHYCSLSSSAAHKPILTDVSYSTMTLRTSDGKIHTIPLKPPMTSWSEARQRTIDMDMECRAALDISDIRITEFEPPASIFQGTVFGLCLLTFAAFAAVKLDKVQPGGLLYQKVLPGFPGGPETFIWIVNKITLPVLGAHFLEAFFLDRTRLRKYGVERGSALWWKWTASCFVEGLACFKRIDKRVKAKTAEKEKSGH